MEREEENKGGGASLPPDSFADSHKHWQSATATASHRYFSTSSRCPFPLEGSTGNAARHQLFATNTHTLSACWNIATHPTERNKWTLSIPKHTFFCFFFPPVVSLCVFAATALLFFPALGIKRPSRSVDEGAELVFLTTALRLPRPWGSEIVAAPLCCFINLVSSAAEFTTPWGRQIREEERRGEKKMKN